MGMGQFTERLLVLDQLPGARSPRLVNVESTRALSDLVQNGWIDRVVELREDDTRSRQACMEHFQKKLRHCRDHRGVPLLGWAVALQAASHDVVAYFDSDMLVHQEAGKSWISEAVEVMRKDSTAMFLAPLPGPPSPLGLLDQAECPQLDDRGNYRFKSFSSRRFLVSKSRLRQLLPVPPLYASWKRRIYGATGGPSPYLPWETCIDAALRASPFYRVHLSSPSAWSLHSPQHSPEWIAALPQIVAAVEKGSYPPDQAGHYDLQLDLWLRWLPSPCAS